jgi:predicted RNA polymerase sigma factor
MCPACPRVVGGVRHAALADNLRRLGRTAEAAEELETAAVLAPTGGERGLLLSHLLDVRSEPA